MGCKESTQATPANSYPRQPSAYPAQPMGQQTGYAGQPMGYPAVPPPSMGMVQQDSGNDRMMEGMLIGGAVGYMAGSQMGHGGGMMGHGGGMMGHGGGMMGGAMGVGMMGAMQPDVNVMGVDVL